MIAAGLITILISLFGCVGALWHNRCCLYMYAIILGILLVLELAGFILAFVYKGQLQETYDTELRKILRKAVDDNNKEILAAFDVLQKQLGCCGANNITDYDPLKVAPPDSCWRDKEQKEAYSGCSQVIIDFLNNKLPIFGGVLGGFMLVELLGLIGAIVLAVALKHAPDDSYSSNPGDVLSGLNPRRYRR